MISGISNTATITVKKWKRPRTGRVKKNIDDALFESIECIGLGIVIRGSEGQFIMARSVRKACLIPPRKDEVLCLKEALSWLKDMSFKKCMYETDSQVLARACKGVGGKS